MGNEIVGPRLIFSLNVAIFVGACSPNTYPGCSNLAQEEQENFLREVVISEVKRIVGNEPSKNFDGVLFTREDALSLSADRLELVNIPTIVDDGLYAETFRLSHKGQKLEFGVIVGRENCAANLSWSAKD